jgi:hypothetical protein
VRKMLIFAAANAVAALTAIWVSDRTSPTETISVWVRPPEIAAGTTGDVLYTYQRFRLCTRHSVRYVVDATGREFQVSVQDSPPYVGRIRNQPNTFVQPFRVPIGAAPGDAQYRVEISDICNPLQNLWPMKKVIEVPFVIKPARG